VVHFIDFEQDRFDDVVTNKLKVFLPEMVFDVVFGTSKERVCSCVYRVRVFVRRVSSLQRTKLCNQNRWLR